jgi:serine/threonine-protein kinase
MSPIEESLRWDRMKELFATARPMAEDARDRFLAESCADDDALRAEIESLLSADGDDTTFLDAPSSEAIAGVTRAGSDLAPGSRVGRYEVVRPIAAGGMGAVFIARRADDAFEKQVALKIVHRSLATPRLRERFHVERQVLATLEHPNITRLLDGGTTDDGLPYLVMEYVEGRSIAEYAQSRELGVRDRVELFLAACDAVEHAHQRLVIHRDLKPGNILVTDDGRVKLLDFGIARILETDAGVAAPGVTVTGSRALTPEYASPEQVRNDPITTASDVYSLGVVLYELLTGRRPYRIDGLAPYEADRVVCEHDPPAPSATTADHAVARALAGDLDTIVLTALRKDPARRYASVEQLAGDLRRHSADLPIHARRDTFVYRTRKLVRRNRPQVIGGLVAVVAGVVALVAVSTGLVQAREGQRAAERATQDAREALGFFEDMLVSTNAYRRGRNVSVVELLAEADRAIPDELAGRPTVEAGVRMALARSYASLMMWPEVAEQVEPALAHLRTHGGTSDEDALVRAECLSLLGRAYTHLKRPGAVAIQREGLALRREVLGPEHALVAESTGNLGFALWSGRADPRWSEAVACYHEALAMYARLGRAACRDAARVTMSLAFMESHRGRTAEAERRYRAALALYAELPVTEDLYELTTMSLYAQLLAGSGRYDEAVEQLERQRSKMPVDLHPEKRRDLTLRIARLLEAQGRSEEAAEELRAARELGRQIYSGP